MFRVGDVVRKLRLAKGWNQTTLGIKAGGINKGTISRLEQGKGANADTLKRLAKALGVPVSVLHQAAEPVRIDTVSSEALRYSDELRARLRAIEDSLRTALALVESWDGRTERRSGADRRSA